MSYYGYRDLREPQSRDRDKLRIITIHNRLNDTTLHSATIFCDYHAVQDKIRRRASSVGGELSYHLDSRSQQNKPRTYEGSYELLDFEFNDTL